MANDGEDGNRLRYEFFKKRQDAVFQRFRFASKIVEILQKCCCSVDFLQEIAFNHLVRAD